jgi:23S rRNA (adenine-N6)-dimethyltransferase
MFKTRRKLLSQNFLWNRELVNKLIRDSSISQNDLVLEIGPGKGIITESLIGSCKHLIAIEADRKLYSDLKTKFPLSQRLSLVYGDFLDYYLPTSEKFKVFSNIPFSITGEIVKKLFLANNPPEDSFLIVQKEAAEKFAVNSCRNTMLAILFHPWFEIKVARPLRRHDFSPMPRIDPCLLRLQKRVVPLIDASLVLSYRDFVVYQFVHNKKASRILPKDWLLIFERFTKSSNYLKSKINGSFSKWQKEERKLSKIHRTRTDASWRKKLV